MNGAESGKILNFFPVELGCNVNNNRFWSKVTSIPHLSSKGG